MSLSNRLVSVKYRMSQCWKSHGKKEIKTEQEKFKINIGEERNYFTMVYTERITHILPGIRTNQNLFVVLYGSRTNGVYLKIFLFFLFQQAVISNRRLLPCRSRRDRRISGMPAGGTEPALLQVRSQTCLRVSHSGARGKGREACNFRTTR